MRSTPSDALRKWLEDPEYARAFGGEMAKSTFAVALSRARRNSGMTQTALADRIGTSQPYVAKLESGEANPTLEKVGRILSTLGLRLVASTEPLNAGLEDNTGHHRLVLGQPLFEDAGRASLLGLQPHSTAAGSEEVVWQQTSHESSVLVGGAI